MRLPGPKHVKDVFEGLLGREVVVTDCTPVLLDSRLRPSTAAYVDDARRLSTVVLMDFALTAWVGAALALLPRGGVEDALEEGQLPSSLLENVAEVYNVLAGVISRTGDLHQRLHEAYGPGVPAPSDVTAWAAVPTSRVNLRLDIKGYGGGTLSMISALPSG
ncbi:MAG: hypothetical protein WB441_01310 [Nocardioidaceae bacterium]